MPRSLKETKNTLLPKRDILDTANRSPTTGFNIGTVYYPKKAHVTDPDQFILWIETILGSIL